jgi:hypothetical protein
MDTSNINVAEELPDIQPADSRPPAGEPLIHMEQRPQIQIEVDLPSGPVNVSRTRTSIYRIS